MTQIKEGRYVITVPIIWRTSMTENDPEATCLHVAKETFGIHTSIVCLEDELYADAISLLERVCVGKGIEFEFIDPEELQVKLDGRVAYVRIADTRKNG